MQTQSDSRSFGRPQVECVDPGRRPIGKIEQPAVLYAPTWQGPFADRTCLLLYRFAPPSGCGAFWPIVPR